MNILYQGALFLATIMILIYAPAEITKNDTM